jgi:hypothetical protein
MVREVYGGLFIGSLGNEPFGSRPELGFGPPERALPPVFWPSGNLRLGRASGRAALSPEGVEAGL